MATPPCYNGPNPIEKLSKIDEQTARTEIWKWAKANGIDHGLGFEQVSDAINKRFFGGVARPEWITDILSGRKTPFRKVANDAWKAQYNRRAIVQQAKDLSRTQGMNPVMKALHKAWTFPRSIAVTGHGFVFPVSHAGDLAFRPASWATFFKGTFDTYKGAYSKAFTERALTDMQSRALYRTAIESGLDVGPKSQPVGILGKPNPISRALAKVVGDPHQAWQMLTVMRYKLWERQMNKFIKPGMSSAEVLDIGKNLAGWANHATGSAKMPIPYAGELLFGPKLTASKISRFVSDPAQTISTFAKMASGMDTTAGERAAAWTRLSGLGQYAGTYLGFLAANQGLNMALKTGQNVNFTDPNKSDFLAFKLGGLESYIPGLHTEIRTLGKILATTWATKKQLRGDTRQAAAAKIFGEYIMAKTTPTIQRGEEALFGQNFMGRPVPWSSDPGTDKKPRLSWGEYLGSIGPIPLEGPIGYVYDKLKKGGASALDAMAIIKGLIIAGVGATGAHIKEEPPPSLKSAVKQHRAAAHLQNR